MMNLDRRVNLPPLTPAGRGGHIPLSFAQQRLWFLAHMKGGSEAYHMPLCIRAEGTLNGIALRRALDRVLARHEILRTTFEVTDGEPVQKITPAEESRFQLTEYDLRQRHDAEQELERLLAEEVLIPFDLTSGPLIRGRLVRLADKDHVLSITMHHIVSDGWSIGIFRNELSTLYEAFRRDDIDPLPALKIQYADYAIWQRRWMEGNLLADQSAYWRRALSGAPEVLELPTDHSRPAQQNYAGGFVGFRLNEQLSARLKALSFKHGVTLYMTLLSAWATLLSRLSGQCDIVVGTPIANRRHRGLENLIGFFVNTLALRLDLSGDPSVTEMLKRTKEQVLAAQKHQDIPFEYVVELIQPARSLAYSPIFQVMFSFQNISRGQLKFDGTTMRPVAPPFRTSKVDLCLYLTETSDDIVGGMEYATVLFDQTTVARYVNYFKLLIENMVANDTQHIGALQLLGETENHRLLYEWNDNKHEFSDHCIHQLIEDQVDRTPEEVALVYENKAITYEQLNRQANKLARYLRQLGVGPDARVAICLERGIEMVVAIIAVLKAGGAYVPMDPSYPAKRLHFMLLDCEPIILITQKDLHLLIRDLTLDLIVVCMDADEIEWQPLLDCNLDNSVGLTPGHLAYVIYTSGSTGTPKGVLIEHRNTTNLIHWAHLAFPVDVFRRALFSTSLNFDLAVFECFVPITLGGCVIIARSVIDLIQNPADVTLINTVPSLISEILKVNGVPSSAQILNLAGEPLTRALAEQAFATTAVTSVCNLYGPTETTTYSTYCFMTRDTGFAQHVGRPIANTRIYILDVYGRPVPTGVVGELYIGGAGVARGYLNRPDLTDEHFLADPFIDEFKARMYRTGDLARWLSDGNVEFLGRNDYQVKIRGFRIELGEIESRLCEHAGISNAVVVTREEAPGDKRLIAYYTSSVMGKEKEQIVNSEELRSYLSRYLPQYMVPSTYVHLECMPLTPNGKLDRKALPVPGRQRGLHSSDIYEAPRGRIEGALAAIWSELLKLDQVGRRDNFFELGGNSLLAVRVMSRLRDGLRLEATVADLFVHPVLADFAFHLESASRSSLPPIVPAGRTWKVSSAPRDHPISSRSTL